MFKRIISAIFATFTLVALGACASPMNHDQNYGRGGYSPQVVDHFPEVQSSVGGVLCTVEVNKKGVGSRTTINVGSLQDCHKVGGFVQNRPSSDHIGQGTFCNIDGMVTREASGSVCEAKAKAKAETLVSGQNVDVKQSAQPNTCAQGKTWTKLNWPGHPQHNGFVCLPEGDPHRH